MLTVHHLGKSQSERPNVVRYLGRVGARPAYRRAMENGDPGMALLLS